MLSDGRFTQGPGVGSRDFDGATDRIDWGAVANLTGSALTISAWIYSDGWAGNADHILQIHQSGDAAMGIILYMPAADNISFYRTGATPLWRLGGMSPSVDLTGAWHHILVTHTGTFTDYTTVHIYLDGVELNAYTTNQNGATETAPTGSWSLGGRKYDDVRNFDGKIAQVGVWNRVLTAGEIANLAVGYSPDLAAASDLLFYFKGNTSSLYNAVSGGTEGTADGTDQLTGVGNGPSISVPMIVLMRFDCWWASCCSWRLARLAGIWMRH
jgi:hypothetical protein